MQKRRIFLISLIIVVFFLLVIIAFNTMMNLGMGLHIAPTPVINEADPLVDNSFITGEPCAPPCWYGLVPGQSTISEVKEVLKELDFILPSSVNYVERIAPNGMEEVSIRYQCPYFDGTESCGYLRLLDGHLDLIMYEVAYHLVIEDVVDIIGEPDFLFLDETHVGGCKIQFLWNEQGIIATYEEISDLVCDLVKNGQHEVRPDLSITRLQYLHIGNDISCGLDCFPWQGFVTEFDE
jgi:hypothetical protein